MSNCFLPIFRFIISYCWAVYMEIINKIYLGFFKVILLKSVNTSYELFKVMIPLTILTKFLEHFKAIELLGRFLEPIMGIMGLEGELGLVWAASMITNLYGAMGVFAEIYPELEASTADITVLSLLILVAHSLPVELGISKQAGVKLLPMFVLRVGSALVMGILLSLFFKYFNLFEEKSIPVWKPETFKDASLFNWAISQGKSFIYIFILIIVLMIFMDILERFKIMDWLTTKITPFILPLGMGKNASFLAVAGFTLGITYGGGLIINETKSGTLSQREVFFSLSLMGLAHGMVEDSLLMAAIGGSLWGILGARIVFSFLFIWLLVRVTSFLSEESFSNLFIEKRFKDMVLMEEDRR